MNGKQALPEDGVPQKERGRYHREAHCNREIKVQDLFNMEIIEFPYSSQFPNLPFEGAP